MTPAEINAAFKVAERNLSDQTLKLRLEVKNIDFVTSEHRVDTDKAIAALQADFAEFKQHILNILEDDRKNQEALIHQQIEKAFASFTTAKVKEIMRKEASL
jgi:hypothetical protein